MDWMDGLDGWMGVFEQFPYYYYYFNYYYCCHCVSIISNHNNFPPAPHTSSHQKDDMGVTEKQQIINCWRPWGGGRRESEVR